MAEAAGRIVMIKKSLKKLAEANAFSPDTAVMPERVGITSSYMISDLIRWENVKRTEDGRIYIANKDEKHR
jgi:hypothetical protein